MVMGKEGKWEDITNKEGSLEYVKTDVSRRKKDVIAAGQDSDQEDWVEEAFNKKKDINHNPSINANGPTEQSIQPKPQEKKRRRTFYYYALRFRYTFPEEDSTMYFSFSQPITFTEILQEIHDKEKLLMPKQLVTDVLNKKKQNEEVYKMMKNN